MKGVKKWGGLVAGNRTERPTLSPKCSNEEVITVPRRILARTDSSERSKANIPLVSNDDRTMLGPQATPRNWAIFEPRNSPPAASSYADGNGGEDRIDETSRKEHASRPQATL
eukprot:3054056-Heterocapsa_arctica.AAC.1